MNNKKYYFAVDLGATSGRTIIGSLSEGKFCLQTISDTSKHEHLTFSCFMIGTIDNVINHIRR